MKQNADWLRCYDCGEAAEGFFGIDDELVCRGCFEDRRRQLHQYFYSPPEKAPMTQRERNAYWLLAYAVFMAIVWFGWQWGPSVLQFWERMAK
jgi:hypothetical protein